MNQHYVLIVHGIGEQKPGFSKSLKDNIQTAYAKHLAQLSSDPIDTSEVDFCEAIWRAATEPSQIQIRTRVFPYFGKANPWMWKAWANPLKWCVLIRYLAPLRHFVISYLGDAIAYDEPPTKDTRYYAMHKLVLEALNSCAEKAAVSPGNQAFLTIVAHSLGSEICKDLISDLLNGEYEKDHLGRGLPLTKWPPALKLVNFITLGSPIALYATQHGSIDTFPPILVKGVIPKDFTWINFYDPQDILGHPLRSLNAQFKAAVSKDLRINAGPWWNPLSATPLCHEMYWENSTVAKAIGWRMALDRTKLKPGLTDLKWKANEDKYLAWLGKYEELPNP